MKERSKSCALILALTFGLLSWNGALEPGPGGPDEPTGGATLRLAERLATARIESPLVELSAAQDLADLDDPALDMLLYEDFEDFDWDFAGWPRVAGADVETQDGNHVLTLSEYFDGASLGWVLPVRTDAFYRFARAVRVQGEPFCDLYVVESSRDFEGSMLDAGAHFLAGRGDALKIHALALESGDEVADTWQRGSTSFYPTPRTRSLMVMIRTRTGVDPATVVYSQSFDDVQLEEVVPSRRERMRLLKGAYAAPAADPALGMRKAGCLLPLPSARGARKGEPAESNYNWRRALYAPPTTELAFDLTFPEGARLRLATGLARETPSKAAARFQVDLARPGAEPERVLDVVRAANMEEWHWEEVDLDLSAWAGSEGTLTLRTLAEKGDPHPLWANPRIEAAAGRSDPMVILIAVDTLRADRLSSYGYERPTTPALDRLAAEGVRFDQARSNCNWTCPSFASIFTGLVPSRHGVSSYGPATPLPDELVTLAEHFQSSGWATRSIAYKVPLFDGNYEQGFDEAFNVPRDVIRGEENLARALEWLEGHRGGPSFLFLHFNDPHQPFVQPAPYDQVYGETSGRQGLYNVPGRDQEDAHEDFRNLYDGAVSYVDSCIGRFLDALRERELYEQATIAFVADHGEQLWEHGRFGHGGADLYDEIVHVPLIVKPRADTFEPGRVITANVSGFDVMPTLLELAGIAPSGELDARSLVPLISGAQEKLDRVVVTESSQHGIAVVDGGYKFVLQPGGAEALFHLVADPRELEDLAPEQPAQLARLRSLAIAYMLEHRPGSYLLAHCGEEPAQLSVSTGSLRTLVGSAPRRDGAQSSVALTPDAWALFEVEGPDAAGVAVRGLEARGPETGFEAWVPGSLPSLQGAGVWRVHGPRGTAQVQTELDPVDAELLESLRALGYAE